MHAAQHAGRAGDALNDETPVLAGGGGPEDQSKAAGTADCAQPLASSQPVKVFATLRAQAMYQLGAVVTKIAGDDGRPEFIVSKGALCTRCRTLDELQVLLTRMGADL